MIDRLIAWLWRHGRRPGLPGNHDAARDDLDVRQADIARRLRLAQAQADAMRRPPRREAPRD